MNDKSSPNQMRILLGRMRTGNPTYGISETEKKKKEMSMRDMLKITRRLNEDTETPTADDEKEEKEKPINVETIFDPEFLEKELIAAFKQKNMTPGIEIEELEAYDTWVLFSGVINGVIQFLFIVTKDEITSRSEFNYLQGFSPDNPENEKIIEVLKTYYETRFISYVRNELFKTSSQA